MGRVARRTTEQPADASVGIKAKAIAYSSLKAEAAAANTRVNALKPTLMQYLATSGEPDDKGHRVWMFDNSLTLGGKKIAGLKRERRTSVSLDEEKVREVLAAKGEKILARVEKEVTETVLDQEEIYVLHQEGVISEEEIDSFFTTTETFALVEVKG